MKLFDGKESASKLVEASVGFHTETDLQKLLTLLSLREK
jgi:hypothetical protein